MGVILSVLTLPLRALRFCVLALGMVCLAIAGATARVKDDKEQAEEAADPEAQKALTEVSEDDDWRRQWWADVGPEDRAEILATGFASLAFIPEKPFVPWWIRRKR